MTARFARSGPGRRQRAVLGIVEARRALCSPVHVVYEIPAMVRAAPPPRLYAILATDAPRAVVFRRSRGWWSLHDWDLATDRLTPGAWFRGTLYPRRCDLSPDGALLVYFALKRTATYHAISKSPWLYALARWKEAGTYTRGLRFTRQDGTSAVGSPDEGSSAPLRDRHRLGLARSGAEQYGVERRRGWVEHEECPSRSPNDAWDERRSVVLAKPSPRGDRRLVLRDRGWDAGDLDGRIEGRRPAFAIERGREVLDLPDAAWADWDRTGRLLVATREGCLEARDASDPSRVRVRHDVADLHPSRGPAPPWAQSW